MPFKHNIFIFVAASYLIVSVLSVKTPELIQPITDLNFLKLIARSGDSDNFDFCAEWLAKESAVLRDDFGNELQKCEASYDTKVGVLDSETSNARNKMANQTRASCETLIDCGNLTSPRDKLDCLYLQGEITAKVSNNVSNEAFTEKGYYEQELNNIKFGDTNCRNQAKLKFDAGSSVLKNAFFECLSGKKPTTTPPTPQSTTQSTTTTTPRDESTTANSK